MRIEWTCPKSGVASRRAPEVDVSFHHAGEWQYGALCSLYRNTDVPLASASSRVTLRIQHSKLLIVNLPGDIDLLHLTSWALVILIKEPQAYLNYKEITTKTNDILLIFHCAFEWNLFSFLCFKGKQLETWWLEQKWSTEHIAFFPLTHRVGGMNLCFQLWNLYSLLSGKEIQDNVHSAVLLPFWLSLQSRILKKGETHSSLSSNLFLSYLNPLKDILL